MDPLEGAAAQAELISAAINGNSNSVQTLGTMGMGPQPEKLLAVGLAHTIKSIRPLIEAVKELQDEVHHLWGHLDEHN